MKELDGENYKKKTWLGSHGANILKTVNWKKLILPKNFIQTTAVIYRYKFFSYKFLLSL